MPDLNELRRARGISPEAFAERLGVHVLTPYKWAKRGVPAERARAVAEALGVTPAEVRPDLWPARTDA